MNTCHLFPLELPQMADVCCDVEMGDSKPQDDSKKEELKNEQPKVEQEKDEVKEESDDQEVETDDEEVESDEGVVETTPQIEDASVVKYSVKTTPYLQR